MEFNSQLTKMQSVMRTYGLCTKIVLKNRSWVYAVRAEASVYKYKSYIVINRRNGIYTILSKIAIEF